MRDNDGVLPLLSKEAYRAFLPAWLLAGVREPDGPNAAMLMVNLRSDPVTEGFTPDQAAGIIQAARFISENSAFGPKDPVHVESVAAVQRAWGHIAIPTSRCSRSRETALRLNGGVMPSKRNGRHHHNVSSHWP